MIILGFFFLFLKKLMLLYLLHALHRNTFDEYPQHVLLRIIENVFLCTH